MVRVISNMILPICFYVTNGDRKYLIKACIKTEGRIIVSLTSFPGRIGRLWLVIESLLRQTQKPDKIILWLSEEQFPDLQTLPKKLLRLQKRGLEIRLCRDDLRSHKKYYYAMQEFPNDIIITVDDDVFYHSFLVENLIKLNQKFPTCVCCNHCSKIEVSNDVIQPYVSWKNQPLAESPGYDIFPIGIGGVLYPPHVLHPTVFNSAAFVKYCFMADDIWLNAMTKQAKNMAVKSFYNSCYLPVMNFRNITLTSKNVNEGFNDGQLAAVRAFCIEALSEDPFKIIEHQMENLIRY